MIQYRRNKLDRDNDGTVSEAEGSLPFVIVRDTTLTTPAGLSIRVLRVRVCHGSMCSMVPTCLFNSRRPKRNAAKAIYSR